ncbi:MurR/RpiR family transcriptional regulator [Pallidibacillus thermolactis]|jgi:DNA-binding MurR/RpiR family transcriptional regulator|uniref:MurR/RpiR family transcriptional regulator n=1 Tax=Pallidibacillus thermolactis TaxID=251051 RepID=UPI0021D9E73C|nr:MurR/RpiR family transcriptional regulator [Pallidibacillus thermolactis]MCU9600466.1 MurR/RpiR family transcriptional regulator [Pallidibacillus thermolactis subsp. kokeshiiformis]
MYNFMAKLLNFIESSTDHTKSEIIISEYILGNVEKLPDMTIYELADACHTSPATITRFCKKFDNITFKELKEYARSFTEFNFNEVRYEQLEEEFEREHIDLYYRELETSLKETRELINSDALVRTVHHMFKAKKVAFFGVTFSHLLARNAFFKFTRLGKYTTSYSNHENQIQEAENLTSRDLAVVISFSGETNFILQITKVLSKRGIPIIAITGNEQSFLAKRAKEIIKVSNRKLTQFKSPIVEELNLLSAVNSIYLAYSLLIK